MTASTRNSVLAVKEEVTEGTPVFPAAVTDYVALQDGFTLEPSFAALESAELTGSIGKSKNVKGLEEPTASLSHYWRHSGVVAQAPNFGPLLKNAFGNETIRATERNTIVGSTTLVVNVDTGEGAEFQRGDAILVKHASNAYEVRNVLSIAGDVLTLSQALSVAPGTGVDLGRNVLYHPADTAHPTHTLTLYRGNAADAAIEQMAGARVTSVGIDFPAGDYINASYDFEGILYNFDPIEIAAADIYIDFTDDAGTYAASITAQTYKDPYKLREAIESAMNALASDAITVSYDDTTGKYTIASDGAVTFSLLWNTGANAANTIGDKIGFNTAADDTGAFTYTSDNAISKASPYAPSFDSANPLVAKSNEVLLGSDTDDVACFQANTVNVTIANTKSDILSVCAESGKKGSVFSAREVTVTISALLESHQAKEFKNFRANDTVKFTYNAGEKTGVNWTEGTVVNVHSPTMVIDSFGLSDADGLVQLDLTLTSFVDSGLGEVFVNFL